MVSTYVNILKVSIDWTGVFFINSVGKIYIFVNKLKNIANFETKNIYEHILYKKGFSFILIVL